MRAGVPETGSGTRTTAAQRSKTHRHEVRFHAGTAGMRAARQQESYRRGAHPVYPERRATRRLRAARTDATRGRAPGHRGAAGADHGRPPSTRAVTATRAQPCSSPAMPPISACCSSPGKLRGRTTGQGPKKPTSACSTTRRPASRAGSEISDPRRQIQFRTAADPLSTDFRRVMPHLVEHGQRPGRRACGQCGCRAPP